MRALADPWVQTFGFLAVASAALTAYARAVPAGAGTTAAAAARGVRWIVDARLAKDADTSDLAAAVGSAKSGDTIYVRAGSYKGPLRPAGGVRLVGLGAPDAVVVDGEADKPLLTVDGGSVFVASMTLRGGAPAVWVSGAGSRAELRHMKVLRSGGDAVSAQSGASVRLERTELLGSKGCGLRLQGSRGSAARSTLSLNDYGVCADTASTFEPGDSDLNGNLRGPTATRP